MNNLTIKEFESIATARVVLDELKEPYGDTYVVDFPYRLALAACQTTLCRLLIEKNLNKIFWPRVRGNRIFLFYLPKKKVAAEVGVITEKSKGTLRKRLRIELIGYKGAAMPGTFADLIEVTDHPKHFINKRRKYGIQKYSRA